MISHRTLAAQVAMLGVLGAIVSSCDRGDQLTRPISSAREASFDKKPDGSVAGRVFVDKTGLATIEFRTGAVDNATNVQIPDGYFRDINYKVYDVSTGKAKEILNRKINFDEKGPQLVAYSQTIPSKNGETKADDKSGKPDKKDAVALGPFAFNAAFVITFEAHLKGVASDPKPDIKVNDTVRVFSNPDLDLAASNVEKLVDGTPVALPSQVQVGVPQTFQALFFNNPGTGTTVGALVTCEAHIFAGTTDVTPALTYRWLPNTGPAFDATKPGSAASDTVTIYPNNTAICRFTTTLPALGNYRIQMKANVLYPNDYDPSNNEVNDTVTVVAGSPIDPPPGGGGFGANAQADDYYFTGLTGALFAPFIGDSSQRAQIDKLSSTIVTNTGLSGTFLLKVKFSTIDTIGGGNLLLPTGTRQLASGTWTGSLPGLVNASISAPDHCVSSDGFGSFPVISSNGNHLEALMCIVEVSPTELAVSTGLRWRPSPEPPMPVLASAGAQYYGDYLIWDTDLSFSTLSLNPVSHAPVGLSGGPITGSGRDVKPCLAFFPVAGAVRCSFETVAMARMHRFK